MTTRQIADCTASTLPADSVTHPTSTPRRATDKFSISTRSGPIFLLRHGSATQRLWIGAACVALFIASIATGYCVASKPGETNSVGFDFIAFYTGGTFVREGRSTELYDLKSVQHFQYDLARKNGVDLGTAIGPYWNPPFYAWLFVPISGMSFPAALHTWLWFNVACAVIAVALLCRILVARKAETQPFGRPLKWGASVPCNFRVWGLIPVLVILSTPFIHALSHAQNTCTSLLLLTLVVIAWRAEKGFLAGLIAGLLLYKPQLGAILIAVLIVTLGWKPLTGMAVTATALLLVTLLTLPGTLPLWLHQMPANLHFVIDQVPYLWDRHVTFKAFWRLLLQGRAAGNPILAVQILSALSAGAIGLGLLWAAIQTRRAASTLPSDGTRFDRIIAATIVCTPLIMPFYFDYDQLLLAVAAVLFARERLHRQSASSGKAEPGASRDRWIARIWPAWYAWLMVNPDVALHTRVNFTVILLAAVAGLLVARAMNPAEIVEEAETSEYRRIAVAA